MAGLQKQKVEHGDEVASVQIAVEVVQKRMRTFDGSFVQFRCDEKGFLSICAFGLPGKTGENGPSRGLQAALSIAEGAGFVSILAFCPSISSLTAKAPSALQHLLGEADGNPGGLRHHLAS